MLIGTKELMYVLFFFLTGGKRKRDVTVAGGWYLSCSASGAQAGVWPMPVRVFRVLISLVVTTEYYIYLSLSGPHTE